MKGIKLLALFLFSTAFFSFTPLKKKYIVIDAGHGGNDSGVVYGEFSEKDISLKIAKKIQKISENQSRYEIILTRNTDSPFSLSERTAQINRLSPEMVISLHVNGSPQEETPNQGTEIFVQNSEQSKKLAGKISGKLNARTIEGRNLHILRETRSPAVLIELGFINNTRDREYMTSENGQQEIAQKFVEVFNEY